MFDLQLFRQSQQLLRRLSLYILKVHHLRLWLQQERIRHGQVPEWRFGPNGAWAYGIAPAFGGCRDGHRRQAIQGGSALMMLPAERRRASRSEEHTSELQSLMRISYAVF